MRKKIQDGLEEDIIYATIRTTLLGNNQRARIISRYHLNTISNILEIRFILHIAIHIHIQI